MKSLFSNRKLMLFVCCLFVFLVYIHPQAQAQTEVCYKGPCRGGLIPACPHDIICTVCDTPSGMCGSPAEGTSCSITLDPSGLLLGSVDFYDVTEDGAEYLGSTLASDSIDALSPIPNCTFEGSETISDGPFIAEPTPPNIVQTVGTEFDWAFSFFDDGDRSFVFDLDDYPFEFLDDLFVVGIDATNGDEYDNLAIAELIITEEDGL